jgi:hypothetical protein
MLAAAGNKVAVIVTVIPRRTTSYQAPHLVLEADLQGRAREAAVRRADRLTRTSQKQRAARHLVCTAPCRREAFQA